MMSDTRTFFSQWWTLIQGKTNVDPRERTLIHGWSSSLVGDCCRVPALGVQGCVIPCWLQAQISKANGRDPVASALCACAGFYFGCSRCNALLFMVPDRHDVRVKAQVRSENWVHDALVVQCCPCCALVQEMKQLQHDQPQKPFESQGHEESTAKAPEQELMGTAQL